MSNVVYTFKHMETSENVIDFSKNHIVEPATKLLGEGIQLQLVFDGPTPDFSINSLLTSPSGSQFKVKETGGNMYACIDAVGKKLVRMIRKEKNISISQKHSPKLNEIMAEEESSLLENHDDPVTSDKAEVTPPAPV